MGTENNREYIKNVARQFMGDLEIKTADYAGMLDRSVLAKVLYQEHVVKILRLFREKRFKPGTIGEIAWYGVGDSPMGEYQGWGIGNETRPSGM